MKIKLVIFGSLYFSFYFEIVQSLGPRRLYKNHICDKEYIQTRILDECIHYKRSSSDYDTNKYDLLNQSQHIKTIVQEPEDAEYYDDILFDADSYFKGEPFNNNGRHKRSKRSSKYPNKKRSPKLRKKRFEKYYEIIESCCKGRVICTDEIFENSCIGDY